MGSELSANRSSAGRSAASGGVGRTGRTGSTGSTGSTGRRLHRSICTFWLGDRCFGLDVGLAAEVVAIESLTPVPVARSALRGVFNLRGTPVALVDLASVLDLPEAERERKGSTALVIRTGDMLAGLLIDRMEAVVAGGRGAFTDPDAVDEHPVVEGFLELDEGGRRVVTVLDSDALVRRLDALRYVSGTDE